MARRASPPDLDPRRRNTMSTAYYNDQAARQQIAASLSKLLADTYTLYLKTQGFHWNVTGPRFHDLHKLFEEQYNELADANDEIAERIRALGAKAPAPMRRRRGCSTPCCSRAAEPVQNSARRRRTVSMKRWRRAAVVRSML